MYTKYNFVLVKLLPFYVGVVSSSAFFDYKEDGDFPKPPSYNVATTLPSYDEAERTKAETSVPLVTGRVSVSLYLHIACGLTGTHTH